MPSRSEGWGGLFKDEQYRLIRSASRAFIRLLRDFEQTTPAAARLPLLTKEGNMRHCNCEHEYLGGEWAVLITLKRVTNPEKGYRTPFPSLARRGVCAEGA